MKEQLLGDLTEDAMKKLRLDRLAKRYSKITGKPCGCAKRKERINRLHEKFRDGTKNKNT